MSTQAIQDEWSPLAHIQALGGEDGKAPPTAPMYLPLSDQRRLRAYNILNALSTNTRRGYLSNSATSRMGIGPDGRPYTKRPESDEYREYGDAALVVDAMRDLVLGEEQTIEVGKDGPLKDWIDNWARSERFTQKLLEGEKKSCGLGDGVYVLGISERAKRPKLRVEDPGFYFPDHMAHVEGWDDDDFPPVVHLLYEYENEDKHVIVNRATWRMVQLDGTETAPWSNPREWTCMYSETEWRRDKLNSKSTVYSDEMGRNGVVVVAPQDLKIDFIPVVHVPNSTGEWGMSVLTLLSQILDDIQSVDSDLAIASQSANPLLVMDGGGSPTLTGMPGESLAMPAGGKAAYIAASLNSQIVYLDTLMKRLAQNSRLGEVLLGRVSPANVPSGYAMALGFHPARQLMRNARTLRDEKFPLIVKFALRMAQAWDWAPAGETPNIDVTLGASLPSDLTAAVAIVKDLLPVHAISTQTAVDILVAAGIPIKEAKDEVKAIFAEDIEAAVRMVDATGNIQAAAERLGIAPATLGTTATDAATTAVPPEQ